jgi:capsular polysaccharide biosynthesis protein
VEFREYAAVLARRWWIVGLVMVAAIVAAFLTTRGQTPMYRSTVRLEATARIDYGQVLAVEKLLRQLAARSRTTAVAQDVELRLKTNLSPEELMNKVRALAIPDVLHVQLEAEDADPERAQRIAQSWADVVQERQVLAMVGVPEAERIQLTVLDRASPAVPVTSGTRSALGASALVGLLIGCILAFLFEYIDPAPRAVRPKESE